MGFDPVSYLIGRRAGRAEADPLKSWSELQLWLRAGQLGQVLEAGDQLNVEVGGTVRDFDVLGLDEDAPVGSGLSHVLTLQAHDTLALDVRFDNPQYLFAVTAEACTAFGWPESGMPAGTYHIILNHGAYGGSTDQDGSFQFTTSMPVPVGGGVRHSTMGKDQTAYAKSQITAGVFVTYAADTVTELESDLICVEGNGGTCLGTSTCSNPTYRDGDFINYTPRQYFGSTRWSTSYLRQVLNSADAALDWTPSTIWSRNGVTAPEGFLHRLDPALRAVLCPVRTRYALSESESADYEDVTDYVKIPTQRDVTGRSESIVTEGPVDANGTLLRSAAYTLWRTLTADSDRIKYSGETAKAWWLSSASTAKAYLSRRITPTGTIAASYPSFVGNAAPCLFIG